MSFNKAILIGRTCGTIELKKTRSGISTASFTLAVDRKGKGKDEPADFIKCTAFFKTAEFAATYVKKGAEILVEGSIHTSKGADGTVYTDVTVNNIEFVGGKASDGWKPSVTFDDAARDASSQTRSGSQASSDVEISDSDLPF